VVAAEAVAAHADSYPARAAEYGPHFRELLDLGAHLPQAKLDAARRRLARIATEVSHLLGEVDAIASPGGGSPAVPLSLEAQYGSMSAFNAALDAALPAPLKIGLVFTVPMNIAGTPAICMPCGFSPEGLPYSLQFAGRHLSEAVLCRIAHAYEQATDWHHRHPPDPAATAAGDHPR
jgi:amidase